MNDLTRPKENQVNAEFAKKALRSGKAAERF
jgi:hypothetical protein